MNKVLLGLFGATIFSIVFWAFSGVSLWLPVEAHEFRAFILILLHVAGLFAWPCYHVMMGIDATYRDKW